MTIDELKSVLEEIIPQQVKDQAELLGKETAVGDSDNPVFFIFNQAQLKEWGDIGLHLFYLLLAKYNIRVITPASNKYEKVKTIVQSH